MAKGMPSMTALLGLLAVAGYQNRDKIGDWLRQSQGQNAVPEQAGQTGTLTDNISGALRDIGGLFAGSSGGKTISDGVEQLVDNFRKAGHGITADSWVSQGENRPVESQEIEYILGADTIADLTAKTGLSRSELLSRLAKVLPDAVNEFTPNGRLPSSNEAGSYFGQRAASI